MSTRTRPRSPYNGRNPVSMKSRGDKAATCSIDLTCVPTIPEELAARMGDGVRLTKAERKEADEAIAAAMKAIRLLRYGEKVGEAVAAEGEDADDFDD